MSDERAAGASSRRPRAGKARPTERAARHVEQTLAMPTSGRVRIAAVADTHSKPHPRSRELLARERPAAVLHAGDIGDLSVLDELGAVAPVIAVRGNIDGHDGPPDSVRLRLLSDGAAVFTLLLTHIAVNGPRLRADAVRAARRRGAQLVVCGHSHVPLLASTDGIAVFNPGSCGPRRFRLPITFGVIDVTPNGVDFRHVDCETGAAWQPA